MSDAVATHVIFEDDHELIVHLTNMSDGTGESEVVKVDKSARGLIAGVEAVALDVEAVQWCIQGFPRVMLEWDHGTDSLMMALCGSGYNDFNGRGKPRKFMQTAGLRDPLTADSTGDILLTAPASATTGSYDITLHLRKRQ